MISNQKRLLPLRRRNLYNTVCAIIDSLTGSSEVSKADRRSRAFPACSKKRTPPG